MKTCRTCLHWHQPPKMASSELLPYGTCDASLDEENPPPTGASVWGMQDFGAELVTGPDFGCISHTEKPTTSESP